MHLQLVAIPFGRCQVIQEHGTFVLAYSSFEPRQKQTHICRQIAAPS